MGFFIRNWELKLGAAGLATILYTGLVFSGSFTDGHLTGVPIQRINQPNGAYVITQELPTVEVHYRQSRDTTSGPTTSSFAATVDLSQYDMQRAGQPQSLPVQVSSLADGISALDYSPTTVTLTLDTLSSKEVDVRVEHGPVPQGLELGTPSLSVTTVSARGPSSLVSQVVSARASISIDASGIDFQGPVELQGVDANGNPVASVDITPSSVIVRVPVTTQETNKTVPVVPRITGSPAAGFQVNAVTVTPATLTVRGTPDLLASVTELSTQAIDLKGLSAAKTFSVKPVLPTGLRAVSGTPATIAVKLDIAAALASKTFLVGVVCRNVPAGDTCLPQVGQISMTLAGSQPALAALKAASFTPSLEVGGLAPGSHAVTPTVSLPAGISLVAFSPGQVTVIISAPSPSPSPAG
jgi:YbbR domain-containing protein